MEGLLSTGPIPSSFDKYSHIWDKYSNIRDKEGNIGDKACTRDFSVVYLGNNYFAITI